MVESLKNCQKIRFPILTVRCNDYSVNNNSHLKIKCYNYMIFFVSLTVTTKEKASVDTQTIIIKESKPTVIVIKSQ